MTAPEASTAARGDGEGVAVVTTGVVIETADVSSDGPVIIAVVDHSVDIMADPFLQLEGHHLRVIHPGTGLSHPMVGPAELQSADVLVYPGGDGEDAVAHCVGLLRAFPGCEVTVAGEVEDYVVVARYAQPLRVAVDLPAPPVASAVYGWIASWYWARRRRPLADMLTRPVVIDYAGRRYPVTLTLDPSL
ncbi:hypothetical protein Ga0074812_15025 [Parafrankia irregularis]|uniref:Uncharacterized protein n=1 Tax=Parafrankia irregularis TaxID=795642 RepID=A0A0S4QZG1_9ACTN|nr:MULTISPECIES: hypothetical protein [Frankiaceae]MBE3204748.1 hypothetical protein [Parafrankia sp. CH37]CUU60925.1 hypothetical protein Ga0074812_15025 [Parafrankia irregularis]